jgi:hypothetical protein
MAIPASAREDSEVSKTIEQVAVKNEDGLRYMSKQDYLKISVVERIQLILQHKVEFIVDGKNIPTRQALEILRAERMEG